MNFFKNLFATLVALGFFLGSVFLVVLFVKTILQYLLDIDSDIARAIIAAAATVIVSVISVIYGKHLEQKKKIAMDIREKKIPQYQEFINFFIDYLQDHDKDKDNSDLDKKLEEAIVKWTKHLFIWGSDDVVSAWVKYRQMARNGSNDQILQIEAVFKAMRKDIGHSGGKLKKGDILGLFINDLDKQIEK